MDAANYTLSISDKALRRGSDYRQAPGRPGGELEGFSVEGKKMFRVLVLRGAVLALSMGNWACSSNSSGSNDSGNPNNDAGQTQNNDSGSPDSGSGTGMDAGPTPDSGQPQDSGQPGDAGNCVCVKDPAWPGNDCGPVGGPSVCCWLQPTAQCCP
jgi:hypothetical protein